MGRFVCALALAVSMAFAVSHAAQAEETIRSFVADIVVQQDGRLDVSETITVKAEGKQIVHGIYRDFPQYFVTPDGVRGKVAFDIVSVERDGAPESWVAEAVEGGTRVRIGDGQRVLVPGKYIYRIRYRSDRQVSFRDDHDELVWNVTGDGWQFPIEMASATVTLPQDNRPQDVAVYTGARGATGHDARASISGNQALFRTTRSLGRFEGLTVDVMLPKDAVLEPNARQLREWWWRDNLGSVVGLGGLAGVVAYFLLVWAAVGRDPKAGTVIPRWDPPKDISPALAGYIDDGGFPRGCWQGLAASAVDLAVKGYVTLENLDKAITLRKLPKSPPPAGLPAGQAVLFKAVGRPGEALVIDQANADKVRSLQTGFRAAIEAENEGLFFRANRGWSLIGLVLSAIVAGAWGLTASLTSGDIVIVAVSCAVPFVLSRVAAKLIAARRMQIPSSTGVGPTLGLAALAAAGIAVFVFLEIVFSETLGANNALSAVAMAWGLVLANRVFFVLNRRATALGSRIRDHIAGLRLYLLLAEKDRMNLADAPLMSPGHYEALLPYAMVLGVEKRWTESFRQWIAASRSGAAAAYAPSWCDGWQGDFTGHIDDFAASMRASMAASIRDTSSSSSFGSGSSGSGGGGGGGGGW